MYMDFTTGLVLYADSLPLAIARSKIFGIIGQSVVKLVYIQAPMNYFLNISNFGIVSGLLCVVRVQLSVNVVTSITWWH